MIEDDMVARGFQLETLTSLEKTMEDISRLSNLGANMVRIPIYLSYQQEIAYWVAFVQNCLRRCAELNIRAAVCIHHPNRGNPNTQEILNVQQFYRDWEVLALNLIGLKAMFIPINEPKKRNSGFTLRAIYRDLKPYILAGGRRRVCFAIPSVRIADLTTWQPIPDYSDQWTEVHFYDWWSTQKSLDIPYPSGPASFANMVKKFDIIKQWKDENKIPVYIGETAFNKDNLSCAKFFEDFLKLCKQRKIPHTIHAYREADIWNYEQNPQAWNVITNNLKA